MILNLPVSEIAKGKLSRSLENMENLLLSYWGQWEGVNRSAWRFIWCDLYRSWAYVFVSEFLKKESFHLSIDPLHLSCDIHIESYRFGSGFFKFPKLIKGVTESFNTGHQLQQVRLSLTVKHGDVDFNL
jgi:hypothetical protein